MARQIMGDEFIELRSKGKAAHGRPLGQVHWPYHITTAILRFCRSKRV